ncbi:MAG TPA: hypothetical protein DCZ13_14915 [Porticoccaceae bacterium]|jgi:LPS-assembly lipoprotein|nr:hypothetical protein [Porticoccaceae bacterium]
MVKNWLLFCVVALALNACGWQLRGSSGVVTFDRLHISAKNPDSGVVRNLERQLEASGVTLVDEARDADYSLVIVNEHSSNRAATISSSARISERSLTESVVFQVLDASGKQIYPRTRASVERVYEYDENNILATDDEARLLKKEMHDDLARQIYNRLRQLRGQPPANAPAS